MAARADCRLYSQSRDGDILRNIFLWKAAMKRRNFLVVLGGITAAPLGVQAQRTATPVIGFLSSGSQDAFAQFVAAFRRGVEAQGFKYGQDVVVEYRWSDGRYENLTTLADDLARRQVALIAATGGVVSARAAMQATKTIPIVFVVGFDPVKLGLVSSLARPTGNATGVSIFTTELASKRFEVLRDLLPQLNEVGILINPGSHTTGAEVEMTGTVTQQLGLQFNVFEAGNAGEIDGAFSQAARQRVHALLVSADPFFTIRRQQIVALAARHALPTMYPFRAYVEDGGLASYGTEVTWAYEQAGFYAGRILNGIKPTDLPIMLPTDFRLTINLQTMHALGITPPLNIAVRAEVIGDVDPVRR
jgi:putative ABC transport system substrate-binding protein